MKAQHGKQRGERFKPSKAGKKRYVLFALKSPKPKAELGKEIWGQFLRLFGRENAMKMRVSLIQFARGAGILRCAHTSVGEAKRALAAMGAMTLSTSGSLKKLRSKIRG